MDKDNVGARVNAGVSMSQPGNYLEHKVGIVTPRFAWHTTGTIGVGAACTRQKSAAACAVAYI